jgi:hypothetical protein
MEPALISLDITPKTPADREKLARALQALAAEDGTQEVRAVVEPNCTVIKQGVSTCEPCAVEREQRETSGGVSAEDEARVVSLLRADVEATIGHGHDEAIIEAAARRRLHADVPAAYVAAVVDDVQQYFHDGFVDTTWPACPRHPNHPLWYSDGWWRCEPIDEPVARLGALSGLNQRHQG